MKKYKELAVAILTVVVIISVFAWFVYLGVENSKQERQADYQLIVEVYQTCGDTHLLRDTSGNIWSVKADLDNTKQYIIGMNTNNTDSIYDDSIVTIDEWKGVEQ